MIGVYVIRQIGTDKVYVGSSLNCEKRFKDHECRLANGRHTSQYLQQAWRKHGSTNFTFEIVEACSAETRLSREQYYIDALNSCFNMSKLAAGGTRPEDWTPERRAKHSMLSMGKPGTRNGAVHTPEAKKKMSASWRTAGRTGMLGKKHRPETIEKIRATNKANVTRRHVGMLGKKHSPEARQKMRLANLGHRQTPEQREKRKASLAAFYAAQSPEYLAEQGRKISAAKRARQLELRL